MWTIKQQNVYNTTAIFEFETFYFQLAKLADVVLKRVPSLADPSTYDDATIDCIGPLIQFLPMQSFDNIPSAAMESAISGGKMKNVTVTSKSMVSYRFDIALRVSRYVWKFIYKCHKCLKICMFHRTPSFWVGLILLNLILSLSLYYGQ